MEKIKLKIASDDTKELENFRIFLHDNYPDLEYNESYSHHPGSNKEPITVAIIIALGGKAILETIKAAYKDYLDNSLEKGKEKNRHNEELFKISKKVGEGEYTAITEKELMEMDKKE
jgi:hypothetical protein